MNIPYGGRHRMTNQLKTLRNGGPPLAWVLQAWLGWCCRQRPCGSGKSTSAGMGKALCDVVGLMEVLEKDAVVGLC